MPYFKLFLGFQDPKSLVCKTIKQKKECGMNRSPRTPFNGC